MAKTRRHTRRRRTRRSRKQRGGSAEELNKAKIDNLVAQLDALDVGAANAKQSMVSFLKATKPNFVFANAEMKTYSGFVEFLDLLIAKLESDDPAPPALLVVYRNKLVNQLLDIQDELP